MLKTPNRPRAPSAATLRVLYQLAYISSGTAVGIGALCAEERRRRTKIVQRVADNAKRIRQSPRYAHGAAAVAVKEHEVENEYGWSVNGDEVESDGLQRTEADRRRTRRLENLGGAKMPGLPSVVQEEYGKLVEGRHKKSNRRVRSARPDFVEAHGHWESTPNADPKEQNVRVRFTPSSSQPSYSGTKINTCYDWMSYQRPQRYGFVTTHELQTTSRKNQLFHATEEGRSYENPHSTYDQVATLFLTREIWTRTHGFQPDLSPETLVRDVGIFFEIVNAKTSVKTSINHACRVADQLLRLSLDLGCTTAARSLLLWKLAVDVLSVEDIFETVTSFASIAESLSPEATKQFFSDLFATSVYCGASEAKQLRVILRLRAEALKLNTHEDYYGPYEELTENIVMRIRLSSSDVAKFLVPECRRLIDSGHLSSAVKLWCMTMRSRRYDEGTEALLETDLFDASLTSRHLSLCVRMLRTNDSRKCGDNSHRKDAFIKVCFEEGGTGLLRNLFGEQRKMALRNNDNLSPESYAYLCRSFADSRRGTQMFKMYYDRVPPELRPSVTKTRASNESFALKAQWKATRHLHDVRAAYEQALKRLEDIGAKEEALRTLHVAMIEVELSANQTVTAVGALLQLNEGGSDGSVAMLTALALAKQKEWATFGRLFETLKNNNTMLDWTPPTTRAFNNVLHLFSRSHSAQQLSDFATMAFDELSFRPNEATWEVLLSGLVSKSAVSLLKYWINLKDASGRKFKLEAQIGAALMKRWYLDSRLPHVMVMWFCRSMVQRASSLRSDALKNLVREAIGFDLRTLHGVNAPRMAPIIRARQALLDNSGDGLPKPGYIWNGRLYDKARSTAGVKSLPRSLMSDQSMVPMKNITTDGADSEVSAVTWVPNLTTKSMNGTETSERDAGSFKSGAGSLEDDSPKANTLAALMAAISVSRPGSNVDNVEAEDIHLSHEENQPAVVTSNVEALEREMISYFSLQQYESALGLYHNSLDAKNLPASPLMLEVAIEASLQSNNDRQEAEQIMSAARDAGMNVTCAMGPLLIDEIRRASLNNIQDVAALRGRTMDYYRSNELNGLHVKHHVGTAAAHTMIQAGFAESGVNLLSTILHSSWCAEASLDITAMSVWLTGYAALGHVDGMHWVVKEVLDQDLGIDNGFMRSLKRARRPAIRLDDGPLTYRKQKPKTLAYLEQWYDICSRKRLAQMQESKVFGRKLANLLATAASGGRAVSQGRGRREAHQVKQSKIGATEGRSKGLARRFRSRPQARAAFDGRDRSGAAESDPF